MNKIKNLLSQYCPDGVPYVQIKDIAVDIYRGSGIKRDEVTEEGIPCVRYGEIYTTYDVWFENCVSYTQISNIVSPKYFEHGDILFAITGESVADIAKSIAYVGYEKCLAGGDIVVLKHNQNPKYLAYVLSTEDARIQKSKGKVKNKVVHSSVPSIKEIYVPIPPLPVQDEIVRILDDFTKKGEELKIKLQEELTARKKQYEYYSNKLLGFDESVPLISLGEIGTVKMCKRILKSQTNTIKGIPFYKIGTFGKEPDSFISQDTFDVYKEKYAYPKEGDILISCAGTIGRTVVFDGKPSYFQDSNIVWLEHDGSKVTNKFLRYCYSKKPWQISEGGIIARLYNDNILKAKIPVPSIEEQNHIVKEFERFDKLYNDIMTSLTAEIEARQRQYEYYRDKLLSFKEV